MKVVFLGTGTSSGVPVIGCDCPVCTSSDPHNRRRRTSLYVEAAGQSVLVDTPPDFRDQALQYNIRRVDAVLFTHSHADHVFGFDDIRRFNTIQNGTIPAYGSPSTIKDLKRIFDYIREDKEPGVYRPQITFRECRGPFTVGELQIEPLPVEHGTCSTIGYLFREGSRRLGYVPDCSVMPEETVQRLVGVDVMILDALRIRPHKTHLTLEGSLKLLRRIGAGRSYIIHMCHDLDHEETQRALPDTVCVSYDGLTLEL